MATRKITAFPFLGLNAGTADIMQAIAAFVKSGFPPNFFKFEHVDTQNGLRDFYKHLRLNSEEPYKISKPKLIITYKMPNFNTGDTGLGENPLRQYPAQYINTDMNGYELFFKDNYDIRLYSSDLRVKSEFDVQIELSTRSDQMATNAFLMNNIRFMYGYRLKGIKTNFLIPNYLIAAIRNLLYRTNSLTPLPEEAVIEFDNHLKTYSNNGIEPIYFNGEKNKKFYKLNREYNTVYLQMTSPPEMNEGEKRDNIYDKFIINFSGFIEFYVPIACIFNSPELVVGSIVSPHIFKSLNSDERTNMGVVTMMSTFKDHVMRPLISTDTLKRIHYEEFLLETPEDEINVLSWLPKDDKDFSSLLSVEEFNKLYKVYLYENEYLLDNNIYTFKDSNYKITIKDGNLTAIYTIEIYKDLVYWDLLQYRRK